MVNRSANSKLNKNGFSLLEIIIALGCTSAVILANTALNSMVIKNHEQTKAVQEAIEQRGQLIQAAFTAPKSSTQTCVDRLGLAGAPPFTSGVDFDITNGNNLIQNNPKVQLNRLFLTRDSFLSSDGITRKFSVQLVANQTVVTGSHQMALPPSILGLMTINLDSSNRIVSCNWDSQNSNAAQFCNNTQGMLTNSGPGGINCNSQAATPIIGTCPSGTSMDMVANHCIPSGVNCYSAYLANNFDGNKLLCDVLPTTVALRYPAGYAPPPAPVSTPPPPPVCLCGSTPMPAGGQQLCVRAYNKSEGFGNHDDMFDVKICNSVGTLQDANPAHFFEEEGNGVSWPWKISSCVNYGGTKYESGIMYKRGNCW